MLDRIRILTLDAYGTPTEWATVEKYAYHEAKGNILWTMGENQVILRGGHNKDGEQSLFEVPTIIAVKGKSNYKYRGRGGIALSRDALIIRDRSLCAYCGDHLEKDETSMDHILPESRGGTFTWMNAVLSCMPCNNHKADRTPEEARMPLLFLPYVPDRNEGLIMRNRNILEDQMNFLMTGVHKKSRLHS